MRIDTNNVNEQKPKNYVRKTKINFYNVQITTD